MRYLLLSLFIAGCAATPKASTAKGFADETPAHCVDVKYASENTIEIFRMCFRYAKHCAIGRQGVLDYGSMAEVKAVSACWRISE